MQNRPRRASRAAPIAAWLLLAAAVALGAAWQQSERAGQPIAIGGPLDDGYVRGFQERERSDFLGGAPFRWSRPESQLRLWAPAADSALTLRMIAPSAPGFSQRLTLSAAGRPLGSFAVEPRPRRYRLLAPPAPAGGDLVVDMASARFPGDTRRELGVVFTGASLDALRPGLADAPGELWRTPLLPLALLLVGLGIARPPWRSPRARDSLAAPLALAAVALLGRIFPGSGLLAAEYALLIALSAAAARAALWLLRRAPRLRPDDDRRAQAWVVGAFALTLVFTFSPSMRQDGVGYYAYLRSLTMDGDLEFTNEYEALWVGYRPIDLFTTRTGMTSNPWSVGPAFFWSPLYGLAHVVVLAGRALGAPWRADGFDPHYIVMISLGSALAGLGALLVSYRICRRWASPQAATLAALALLFASNLLYFMQRRGCYAHALGALCSSLVVLAWLRLEERPSLGRWAALGAAAGAMLLTYWVGGLTLLLGALAFCRLAIAALRGPSADRWPALGRLALGGGAAAAIAALIFAPQMAAWQVIYGSPLTVPQGSGFATPGVPRIPAMLVGQPYGLLEWTPALFFGLAALPLLWRRARWLTVCLAASAALYIWYNSTIPDWHGSGGFGLRRLSLLAPWAAVGLALLFDALRRRAPAALLAAVIWAGVWGLMLLVRLDHDLIPYRVEDLMQRPLVELFVSRSALPLWDVGRLLLGSYFGDLVRALPDPFDAAWLAALAAFSAAGTWLTARALGPARHPAPTRDIA